MTAGAAHASSRPPKPAAAPFTGLPDYPALRELRRHPQWVSWDYVWKEDREKWDKPPFNPKTGRFGSATDPSAWSDYDSAARRAVQDGLAGVGFALAPDGNISGIDLDKCRNPETGEFQHWAQVAIDFGETYAEVSPSGTGLRFFVVGLVDGRKIDAAQVEIYTEGRYLTVTGEHVEGTPTEIGEAPRLVAYLQERADQFRAAQQAAAEMAREAERKRQAREEAARAANEGAGQSASERARAGATGGRGRIHEAFAGSSEPDPFWRNVNSRALANLPTWVPALLPDARPAPGGGYRVTSRNLARDLEEDLSISPEGIKDFGLHDMGDPNDGKRTPIALVLEYSDVGTAAEAALWLCNKMGTDPQSLGWKGRAGTKKDQRAGAGRQQDQGDEFAAGSAPGNEGEKRERSTIAHQGVLVPVERDRLDIAQKLAAAPPFPVEALPPVMRGAVEALQEHVQAPQPLCAHSIMSAAMIVSQGLADIEIGPLGSATPLSLFMLVVAVSGERKSACDNLALVAVSQHEEMLRRDYEDDLKHHKAARAAYDAERRSIERNGKINAAERRQQLMDLREPEAPLLPVMRAKEPNLEGLLNLLTHGHASVGIFTSEGGQYLGGHGMGEDARTRNITGLSELWDSGSAQRIRAKETAFLHGRRVGISLAAQPKIASSLLCDELARDQGFVGRFLITMPESTIGTRQIKESRPLADSRLQAFHRRSRMILEAPLPLREGRRNEVDPPALRLSPEAWEVWRALAQSIEDDCRQDGMWMPVRSAALKMAENVARIAGILTVFEDANAASARGGTVSGETMAAAAAIGMFYLREALRLTGHSALDPETRALQEMAEWLVSEKVGIGHLINSTGIQRLAPNHLRTDAATTQARIRKLVEFGALEYVGRAEIDGKAVREAYRVAGEEARK